MIAAYRARRSDGSYPAIPIDRVDNSVMLGARHAGDSRQGDRRPGAVVVRRLQPSEPWR